MNAELWARLDDLYAEALALPAGPREAFVAGIRGEDEELGRELESLLAAAGNAGEFLNTPAVDVRALTEWAEDGGPDPLVGTVLGAYLIERRLGAGGMGVVYVARQQSPQRLVALKVVRPDAVSSAVLRRFEHEAELLARLVHPGIAQVYESGRAPTPLGVRPFFAMELVEGRSLLAYAEATALGVRHRLELFALICDAVQHAHQRGVIHRDLKPGNILVTERGEPKILDFGVARLTDSDIRITTLRTDVGQLLGTVPYMSPEQASGNAGDLDVRSDVYALGVVLYELLAGRLPYDLRGKPVAEAVRVITETDPTHLSSVGRQFRGDVETIVSKALEKDKSRRYQSAGELAEDIRRYLADRAILARPASSVYQFRKFARRNMALVGGVLAAFVLLTGGIVGTSIGMVRARDSAQKAHDSEKAAKETAERAEQANAYLRNTISWFTPGRVKGSTVTVEEVLDTVSARIDKELAGQPAVAAILHEAVCEGYLSLNRLDKVEVHAARALECLESAGTADSVNAGRCILLQAGVAQARGRPAEAEPLARRALDLHRRHLPPDNPEIAKVRVTLGMVLSAQRRGEEAERELVPAIADLRAYGKDPVTLVGALNELSMAYRALAKHDLSLAVMREAVELARATPAMDSETTGVLLNNFANRLKDRGDYEEAERLYLEAIEVRRKTFGDDHPSVALAINNLGVLCHRRGRLAEAAEHYSKALEIRRRLLEPDHPLTAVSISNVAQVHEETGDLAGAEVLYREALAVWQKARGPDHPDTAATRGMLGGLVAGRQRYGEAEEMLVSSIEILQKSESSGFDLSQIRQRYATLKALQGKHAEAESICRENLAWLEKNLPTRLDLIGQTRLALARALRALGRSAEAVEPARRGVEEVATVMVARAPRLAAARLTLAGVLDDAGKPQEAEPILRDLIANYSAAEARGTPSLAACESELGACLTALGRFEEARNSFLARLKDWGPRPMRTPRPL